MTPPESVRLSATPELEALFASMRNLVSEEELGEGVLVQRFANHGRFLQLAKLLIDERDLFSNDEHALLGWGLGPHSLVKSLRVGDTFGYPETFSDLESMLVAVSGVAELTSEKTVPAGEGRVRIPISCPFNLKPKGGPCVVIWKGQLTESNLARYLESNFLQNLPQTVERMRGLRDGCKKYVGIAW